MATVSRRSCDICGKLIEDQKFVMMALADARIEDDYHETDLCLKCYDRLRALMSRGLPKISEIVSPPDTDSSSDT